MHRYATLSLALAATLVTACGTDARLADPARAPADPLPVAERRMPAEWEPQAAVWLQWPQAWEGAAVQQVFVDIVRVIARYEPVRLIAADDATLRRGQAALADVAGPIEWIVLPADASWMRDNGPRYVLRDGELIVQNWDFSAYGLAESYAEYRNDDLNPAAIAAQLGLAVERVDLVHERGDLEVNGRDTAMVNWSVVAHRNPGVSRADAVARFQAALGVERVIIVEGFSPDDITRGHIDGMARFIDADTVVVADDGSALLDRVADQIRAQAPDLTVERLLVYPGDPVINWLVGNGFVLTGSTGDPEGDALVRADLEAWFPGRAVHFVDVGAVWANGGGVHCVTNDQPAVAR